MGISKRRKRSRKLLDSKEQWKIQPKKVVIGISILFIIVFFSVLFAIINSVNTKILPRIEVEGISISNLEIDEAYQKVIDKLKERKKKEIMLQYGEYQTTLSLEQLEVKYDVIEAVNDAYRIRKK